MSMIRKVGSRRSMTALQIATESSSSPKSVMNTIVCPGGFGEGCVTPACWPSSPGKARPSTASSSALAKTLFLNSSISTLVLTRHWVCSRGNVLVRAQISAKAAQVTIRIRRRADYSIIHGSLRLKCQPALLSLPKHVCQLGRVVHEHVRRRVFERVRRQTVGHANGISAGVARGDDIHVGVADDHRFFRTSVGFRQERFDARGIGFLGMETVAAVDLKEVLAEPQSLDDRL